MVAAKELDRRDVTEPDIEFPSSGSHVDQDGNAGITPRLGRSRVPESDDSSLNKPNESSQVQGSQVEVDASGGGAVYVERAEASPGTLSGSMDPDEELSQQLSLEQEIETA